MFRTVLKNKNAYEKSASKRKLKILEDNIFAEELKKIKLLTSFFSAINRDAHSEKIHNEIWNINEKMRIKYYWYVIHVTHLVWYMTLVKFSVGFVCGRSCSPGWSGHLWGYRIIRNWITSWWWISNRFGKFSSNTDLKFTQIHIKNGIMPAHVFSLSTRFQKSLFFQMFL